MSRSPNSRRMPGRRWALFGAGLLAVVAALIAILWVALSSNGETEVVETEGATTGHALGPLDAPVTVLEFSDFQ